MKDIGKNIHAPVKNIILLLNYKYVKIKILLMVSNCFDRAIEYGNQLWASVTKLSKNQSITLEVLMKICKTLQCDIGDIMEFIPDDNLGKE